MFLKSPVAFLSGGFWLWFISDRKGVPPNYCMGTSHRNNIARDIIVFEFPYLLSYVSSFLSVSLFSYHWNCWKEITSSLTDKHKVSKKIAQRVQIP